MTDYNTNRPQMELEPGPSIATPSSATASPETTPSVGIGTASTMSVVQDELPTGSDLTSRSSSPDRGVRFVAAGEDRNLHSRGGFLTSSQRSAGFVPTIVAGRTTHLGEAYLRSQGIINMNRGRTTLPPLSLAQVPTGSSSLSYAQVVQGPHPNPVRPNISAQATSVGFRLDLQSQSSASGGTSNSALDIARQFLQHAPTESKDSPRKIYHLDRRYITGEFDYTTPICVITEVFKTHGLNLPAKPITTEEQITFMLNEIIKTKTALIHANGYCLPPDSHLPIISNTHELELAARYVSTAMPNRVWKYRELMVAFLHLQQYSISNNQAPLPDGDWQAGPKTQERPLSYDATLLYRICRYYGVHTNRDTTLEELARLVQSLTMNTDTLRQRLQDVIQCLPKWALINTVAALHNQGDITVPTQLGKSEEKVDVSWLPSREASILTSDPPRDLPAFDPSTLSMNDLNMSLDHLHNPSKYILRIAPHSHIEAILFAASVFKINIIESTNPTLEYMAMRNHRQEDSPLGLVSVGGASSTEMVPLRSYGSGHSPGVTSSLVPSGRSPDMRLRYTPVDPHFRRRYYKNSLWYDISKTWTPMLNNIYTANELNAFVQQEGYSEEEILRMQPYELLQMSRTEPNFYYGQHPDCNYEHTPILYEDVKDLDPHLIVSYGIAELSTTNMQIYSVNELAIHFGKSKSFQDPQQGRQSLPKHAISKLKKISQAVVIGNNSAHVKNEYSRLLVAIDTIEQASRFDNPIVIRLRDEYEASPVEVKSQVEALLTSLLHAGMYMRGWQVPERMEYPLRSIDTTYDAEYKDSVDRRSIEALQQFKDQMDLLPVSLQNKVTALPLMNFRRTMLTDDVEFYSSSTDLEGRTILNRIDIVLNGDVTTNMNSCIRMSSNWLCASAYFYMIGLRMAAPFNLQQLDTIS